MYLKCHVQNRKTPSELRFSCLKARQHQPSMRGATCEVAFTWPRSSSAKKSQQAQHIGLVVNSFLAVKCCMMRSTSAAGSHVPFERSL